MIYTVTLDASPFPEGIDPDALLAFAETLEDTAAITDPVVSGGGTPPRVSVILCVRAAGRESAERRAAAAFIDALRTVRLGEASVTVVSAVPRGHAGGPLAALGG